EAADKEDMAFRIGGDEFLILGLKDESTTAADEFSARAEKIIAEWNQKLKLPYKIGMSYGPILKKVDGAANEFSDLLRKSDTRMYEMKRHRDTYRR
ncbi:MAG: diguanylate cyclase, partial [Treponema sp.]|nr:diguanylate cyclase [Treponema sp.]